MNKKSYMFIVFIILFFIISCTENGVECGLTGKWNVIDLEVEESSVDFKKVDGLLVITYNDTYELDMEYEVYDIKIEMDDYGELKACAYNKCIQFFSDDDDGSTLHGDRDSLNCRYNLSGSNLTIYNDDITMKFTKNYQ